MSAEKGQTSDREMESFSGQYLYGDDFSTEQIAQWHRDEAEAYANLGAKDRASYRYLHHGLNIRYGYSLLPRRDFASVLGVGSAWGEEFLPIAGQIRQLTILEPSDAFIDVDVGGIRPRYVKPDPSGTFPFEQRSFDLITCLDVLHHIPNVTHVIHEVARCLKPDGYTLISEPTVTMGDWRQPRRGLTRHERGIPRTFFRPTLEAAGLRVISERQCMFPITRRIPRWLSRAPFNSPVALTFDELTSRMFSWNWRYHPRLWWHKFRPMLLFLIAQKSSLT